MRCGRSTHQILNPHIGPVVVQSYAHDRCWRPRIRLVLQNLLRRVLDLLGWFIRGCFDLDGSLLDLVDRPRRSRHGLRGLLFRTEQLDMAKVRVEEDDEAVESGRQDSRFRVCRLLVLDCLRGR